MYQNTMNSRNVSSWFLFCHLSSTTGWVEIAVRPCTTGEYWSHETQVIIMKNSWMYPWAIFSGGLCTMKYRWKTRWPITVWSPHTSKDICALESVQRRAARWINTKYNPDTHKWTKSSDICFKELRCMAYSRTLLTVLCNISDGTWSTWQNWPFFIYTSLPCLLFGIFHVFL